MFYYTHAVRVRPVAKGESLSSLGRLWAAIRITWALKKNASHMKTREHVPGLRYWRWRNECANCYCFLALLLDFEVGFCGGNRTQSQCEPINGRCRPFSFFYFERMQAVSFLSKFLNF